MENNDTVNIPILTGNQKLNETMPILTGNQKLNETHLTNLKCALKSKSQLITCPYCDSHEDSKIQKTCNKKNMFFCIFTFGLCWAPCKLIRKKDCNCYNVKHICSNEKCGKELNNYSAC